MLDRYAGEELLFDGNILSLWKKRDAADGEPTRLPLMVGALADAAYDRHGIGDPWAPQRNTDTEHTVTTIELVCRNAAAVPASRIGPSMLVEPAAYAERSALLTKLDERLLFLYAACAHHPERVVPWARAHENTICAMGMTGVMSARPETVAAAQHVLSWMADACP